jgi:hypothetical protein
MNYLFKNKNLCSKIFQFGITANMQAVFSASNGSYASGKFNDQLVHEQPTVFLSPQRRNRECLEVFILSFKWNSPAVDLLIFVFVRVQSPPWFLFQLLFLMLWLMQLECIEYNSTNHCLYSGSHEAREQAVLHVSHADVSGCILKINLENVALVLKL